MKYPCNLIKDILPLYYDKVCSEDTKHIVEEHLSECSDCNKYYIQMYSEDSCATEIYNRDIEKQKAKSFVCVKNKIVKKQILVTTIAIVFIILFLFSMIMLLKSSTNVIEYNGNISVSVDNGNIVAYLKGSQANHLKIKTVFLGDEDSEKACLFFYMTDTKWDDIITSSKMFSEYTLCASNKGANNIYEVYYYIGEYENLDDMNEIELGKIKDKSIKLWSK